ncbi:MAG: 50S ribosomal protein L4, partial [Deltaproteobacteria bacterium]
RVGSTRSPLWRHGGVVFGPHPRDFSVDVPKKMKNSALKFALTEKAKANDLVVIDAIEFKAPKTKEGVALVKKLDCAAAKRVLILVDKMGEDLVRALSNIANIAVAPAKDVTTYDILAANKVVITKEGLAQLTKRVKAG